MVFPNYVWPDLQLIPCGPIKHAIIMDTLNAWMLASGIDLQEAVLTALDISFGKKSSPMAMSVVEKTGVQTDSDDSSSELEDDGVAPDADFRKEMLKLGRMVRKRMAKTMKGVPVEAYNGGGGGDAATSSPGNEPKGQ